MHKIKSLLIATVVTLSIGAVMIPIDPNGPETDPSETTETTETTETPEIVPFHDGPLEN
ncbi:MAG TPA: hypothetical protein IAC96_06020 [Candidatus Fimimorpha faecalis]|uniref:Uncharacterized protein n=1 Tax=Candidatus Fimimorpha faecalis TaxID=2840824 RepID=A0A9D1EDR8_9FIRM|nr:hypothetical protein [Candidatus Fimimorpha faecalis]